MEVAIEKWGCCREEPEQVMLWPLKLFCALNTEALDTGVGKAPSVLEQSLKERNTDCGGLDGDFPEGTRTLPATGLGAICVILTKNMASLCSCLENLSKDEFKDDG